MALVTNAMSSELRFWIKVIIMTNPFFAGPNALKACQPDSSNTNMHAFNKS